MLVLVIDFCVLLLIAIFGLDLCVNDTLWSVGLDNIQLFVRTVQDDDSPLHFHKEIGRLFSKY